MQRQGTVSDFKGPNSGSWVSYMLCNKSYVMQVYCVARIFEHRA